MACQARTENSKQAIGWVSILVAPIGRRDPDEPMGIRPWLVFCAKCAETRNIPNPYEREVKIDLDEGDKYKYG